MFEDAKRAVETEDLEAVRQLCIANGRVSPMPIPWNDLWEMLPDRERVGSSWIPLPPIILSGWHTTTAEQKRERLFSHLLWAERKGVLRRIEQFLASLDEQQWLHDSEWPSRKIRKR